jgi:hypothetical protein
MSDPKLRPATDLTLTQLLRRRVVFCTDDAHHDCWHFRMGLQTGVVAKVGQTLRQKAELMGPDFAIPQELLEDEEEPKLWVKVDPCPGFARGCETAAPRECLWVVEP